MFKEQIKGLEAGQRHCAEMQEAEKERADGKAMQYWLFRKLAYKEATRVLTELQSRYERETKKSWLVRILRFYLNGKENKELQAKFRVVAGLKLLHITDRLLATESKRSYSRGVLWG